MEQKRAPTDYRRLIALLRRSLPALLLCAILGAELAAVCVRFWPQPPRQALALLLVDPRANRSAALTGQQISAAKQMVGTYAVLLCNDTLLENIKETWQMDATVADLRQRVTALPVEDTQLIQLSVRDEDPARALAVLQSIVESAPGALANFVGGGALQVVSPPRVEEEPARDGGVWPLLLGAGMGLLLCAVWLFVRTRAIRRFISERDVESNLALPVLGRLPPVRGLAFLRGVLVWRQDEAPASYREELESLCINVRFLLEEQSCKVVLVTGAAAREGKSSVAVNLAAALADAGLRVLVVEGNLRRPVLHKAMDIVPPAVLQDALLGAVPREECMYPAAGLGFWVLPARREPGPPTAVLGGPAMRELISTFEHQYDVILLDSPAAAPMADTAALSRLAGGVLLVLRQWGTTVAQAARARRSLDAVGAQWLGVVYNEFDAV